METRAEWLEYWRHALDYMSLSVSDIENIVTAAALKPHLPAHHYKFGVLASAHLISTVRVLYPDLRDEYQHAILEMASELGFIMEKELDTK